MAAVKIAAAPGRRIGGLLSTHSTNSSSRCRRLERWCSSRRHPVRQVSIRNAMIAGEQQREPAALDQFRRVGGDEDQVDDEEKPVHRRDCERVVAPFQRDEGRQHGGDRHQHRDGDAVGATERVGGAEADHGADRANGERPVHDRNIDLALLVTGRVQHAHTRQEAELHRLLRERERAGDDGLRGDDGGKRREYDERVVGPIGAREDRTDSRARRAQ